MSEVAMDGPDLTASDGKLIDRSVREQDRFLDHCARHRVEVTLFLMSGSQFIGIVFDHDRKCILLGGKSQKKEPRLIMKSYISLVIPTEPIELFIQYRGMGTSLTRKRLLKKAKRAQDCGRVSLSARSKQNAKAGTKPKAGARITTKRKLRPPAE